MGVTVNPDGSVTTLNGDGSTTTTMPPHPSDTTAGATTPKDPDGS
jgi:hypothetical protein